MGARERLSRIVGTAHTYKLHLAHHGGDLAAAAWDLASLKLEAHRPVGRAPSPAELYSAAQEIAQITGWLEPMPTVSDLCRAVREPLRSPNGRDH